ncbi:helix-turn-helix domain-containing protein [Desulforhopalus sp. 52FAK]
MTKLEISSEYARLVKKVRNTIGCSQEDLARELGVSFATVNRWENQQSKPSRLAWGQFKLFCEEMVAQGKLSKLPKF